MADDALHQVLAHVIALAHPDQQALATVRQGEAAPVVAVQLDIVETGALRRVVEGRGAGRAHQAPAVPVPHLEGQFAFVGMADLVRPGAAQGGVEGAVEAVPFGAGQRHVHHPQQQPRVLRQLGIVDLLDLMAAVAVIEVDDEQGAEQQQDHHQPQGAAAQRGHGWPSTR
ncbi:hypothetical protein D3C85_1032150 [compost metagenome]